MTADSRRVRLQAALAAYGEHHQNPRNKAIHCICVPAIVFSIIGILLAVNFGITLFAIAAAILVYNRFGQKTALQMAAILILMMVIWATLMPSQHILAIAIAIFILGWTGQFAGHIHEGSKPSFVHNIQSLLIAPLFVVAELKQRLARNPRFGSF